MLPLAVPVPLCQLLLRDENDHNRCVYACIHAIYGFLFNFCSACVHSTAPPLALCFLNEYMVMTSIINTECFKVLIRPLTLDLRWQDHDAMIERLAHP